jgi:hypothetical protein
VNPLSGVLADGHEPTAHCDTPWLPKLARRIASPAERAAPRSIVAVEHVDIVVALVDEVELGPGKGHTTVAREGATGFMRRR